MEKLLENICPKRKDPEKRYKGRMNPKSVEPNRISKEEKTKFRQKNFDSCLFLID